MNKGGIGVKESGYLYPIWLSTYLPPLSTYKGDGGGCPEMTGATTG